MLTKKLILVSFLLVSLFAHSSCDEERFKIKEGNLIPPPVDQPAKEDDSEKDDNETIANGDEIIVDMNGYGGPDIQYWRGAQGPGMNGFFNNESQRECLRIHAENGMKIYNGTRRLSTDPRKGDFYIDNDGKPATAPISDYVDIKRYAHELGIELICMLDGTPSWAIDVEHETFHWGDPNFSVKPEDAIADHAPLPKAGKPMEDFQNLFVEFAIESDAAVADDYNSIWIGTQEIAHTIGFRDGIKNDVTQKEAIRRYIDFWRPIANGLRNVGKKVGGIQLNSSNTGFYDYAINYMIQQNLKLDYLTFQFYQWGNENPMKLAAESTRKYKTNMNLPNTKLIIDRGASGKITDQDKSSCGKFITFLQGEKFCMNEADIVYGYTLDSGVGAFVSQKEYNNIEWRTKYWLYNLGDPSSPNKRRPMADGTLPKGVDGFMTTKGNVLYGVLWNTGVPGLNSQKIEIQLQNTQVTYTDKPRVWKGSGETLTEIKCKLSNNIISDITLLSDEYLLIQLSNR